MLRITVIEAVNARTRLLVEGRLTGRSVEELRQSCEIQASRGAAFTLDLTDLSFADTQGIALLRELKRRDVALENLEPYLALQLQGPGMGCA